MLDSNAGRIALIPKVIFVEGRDEKGIKKTVCAFLKILHPTGTPTDEEFEVEITRETPRLVSIRETPAPGDKQDGITARAKVPSWDEIMFGQKPKEDPENTS